MIKFKASLGSTAISCLFNENKVESGRVAGQ